MDIDFDDTEMARAIGGVVDSESTVGKYLPPEFLCTKIN